MLFYAHEEMSTEILTTLILSAANNILCGFVNQFKQNKQQSSIVFSLDILKSKSGLDNISWFKSKQIRSGCLQ